MSGTALVKSQSRALQSYRDLEQRIQKNDLDALLARWEFGKKLVAEQVGPNALGRIEWGQRLASLSDQLKISRQEISNRMQLAEEYDKDGLSGALDRFGSWFGICKNGLGSRGAVEPPPLGSKEGERSADGAFLDAETWDAPQADEPSDDTEPQQRDPKPPSAKSLIEFWRSLRGQVSDSVADTLRWSASLSPEARAFIWTQAVVPMVRDLQKLNSTRKAGRKT